MLNGVRAANVPLEDAARELVRLLLMIEQVRRHNGGWELAQGAEVARHTAMAGKRHERRWVPTMFGEGGGSSSRSRIRRQNWRLHGAGQKGGPRCKLRNESTVKEMGWRFAIPPREGRFEFAASDIKANPPSRD